MFVSERGPVETGRSKAGSSQGAPCGTQSQDRDHALNQRQRDKQTSSQEEPDMGLNPRIITLAEGRHSMAQPTELPRCL